MIAYLDIAKKLLRKFKIYKIFQIPWEENEKADALSKLASATMSIRSKAIPVAHLRKSWCRRSDQFKATRPHSSESIWRKIFYPRMLWKKNASNTGQPGTQF